MLDCKFTEVSVAMRDFQLLQLIVIAHHEMYYINVVSIFLVICLFTKLMVLLQV